MIQYSCALLYTLISHPFPLFYMTLPFLLSHFALQNTKSLDHGSSGFFRKQNHRKIQSLSFGRSRSNVLFLVSATLQKYSVESTSLSPTLPLPLFLYSPFLSLYFSPLHLSPSPFTSITNARFRSSKPQKNFRPRYMCECFLNCWFFWNALVRVMWVRERHYVA
jgi:hypothetical protein